MAAAIQERGSRSASKVQYCFAGAVFVNDNHAACYQVDCVLERRKRNLPAESSDCGVRDFVHETSIFFGPFNCKLPEGKTSLEIGDEGVPLSLCSKGLICNFLRRRRSEKSCTDGNLLFCAFTSQASSVNQPFGQFF
jgi:hypothetical protein